jgi:hypothetical protein
MSEILSVSLKKGTAASAMAVTTAPGAGMADTPEEPFRRGLLRRISCSKVTKLVLFQL